MVNVDTPQTLGEKLLQTDFSGIIQIISILANIFGLLIAYVGYRKGCASATTAAMALENLGKAKARVISVVTEKVPDEFLEDLTEYWYHIKPLLYLIGTLLALKILLWSLRQIYMYLTIRLMITPIDGTPGQSNRTNVYMIITNGIYSLKVYVYT